MKVARSSGYPKTTCNSLEIGKPFLNSIETFYAEIPEGAEAHRFKTWEYCYKYFKENREKLQISKELPNEALLIFSFYLASWGMYRGSSFLLSLDHTIHVDILQELLKSDYDVLTTDISDLEAEGENYFITMLMQAKDKISNTYNPIREKVYNKNRLFHEKIGKPFKKKEAPRSEISNILASKILLGIFGCIPAYDTLFKQGIKEVFSKGENGRYPISQNFNKGSIRQIIECYRQNKELFYEQRYFLKIDGSTPYPTMKKIDMLFWIEGYKQSKNEEQA